MESYKQEGTDASKRLLISEHALLVARLSEEVDDARKHEIHNRLSDIETQLQMSPEEIARAAIDRYRSNT